MSENNRRDKPKKKLHIQPKDHKYRPPNRNTNDDVKELSLSSTSSSQEQKQMENQLGDNGKYDLFNNPFVEAAKRSLSQEDIDNYKKMGEKFYAGWDFENGGPEHILDVALAEITEAIKSGLHPSDLDDNEKEILKTKMGEEWYTHFGFEKEDLNGIRI